MKKIANVQNIEIGKGACDHVGVNWQYVLQGFLVGMSILAMVAFWATFVYAIWIGNLELVMVFTYIITFGAVVFGSIHFLSKLYQHITRM